MSGWFKSTYSNSFSNCVEVDDSGPGMAVRDSKDPDGPVLEFTPAEWQAFLGELRASYGPSFSSSI